MNNQYNALPRPNLLTYYSPTDDRDGGGREGGSANKYPVYWFIWVINICTLGGKISDLNSPSFDSTELYVIDEHSGSQHIFKCLVTLKSFVFFSYSQYIKLNKRLLELLSVSVTGSV